MATTEALLQHGASLEKHIWQGYTPLQFAIVCKSICHIKLFLKHGANPNTKSKDLEPEDAYQVANRVGDTSIKKLITQCRGQNSDH